MPAVDRVVRIRGPIAVMPMSRRFGKRRHHSTRASGRELVGSGTTVQHVVAATTDQRVVAGAAAQVIGARTAGHEIAVTSATPWIQ
jgi:hypothetical protein